MEPQEGGKSPRVDREGAWGADGGSRARPMSLRRAGMHDFRHKAMTKYKRRSSGCSGCMAESKWPEPQIPEVDIRGPQGSGSAYFSRLPSSRHGTPSLKGQGSRHVELFAVSRTGHFLSHLLLCPHTASLHEMF